MGRSKAGENNAPAVIESPGARPDGRIHRVDLRDITFSAGEHPFFMFVDELGQERGMLQSRICEVYKDEVLMWKEPSREHRC